jgi:translation initiation factor RLI1
VDALRIIRIIKSKRKRCSMACRKACSTNRGEEERVQVIDGKARGKKTARKTKREVGG